MILSLQDNFLDGKSKAKGVGVGGVGGTAASSSKSLDALIHCLNQYLKMMTVHGVDQDIVNQVD